MNIIDQIVAFFSPSAGLRRAQNRLAMEKLRRYEAAAHGRRTDGWNAISTSANQETEYQLTTLRNRSRDLDRNNPYIHRAFNVIANNVVGTGIKPTPDDGNSKLKELWKEYSKVAVFGGGSIYGAQWLIMRTVANAGEVIVRKIRTKDKRFPIKIQVLEPDFIDSSRTSIGYESDGSYDMQGIRFNRNGERTHYWLYDRHPSDFGEVQSKMVPADEVLHIYVEQRAGQVRGVPFFAPVGLRVKNFDEMEDAKLMQQQVAACFAAFVTDVDNPGSTEDGRNIEQIQPGIIEYLPPGKSIAFANPPAVHGFAEYSRQVLSAIAVGIGVTYEAMTGDLANVNFSSGRMGWLEFARNVANWQAMLITKFCDPVWEWFLEGLQLANGMPASEAPSASWTTPRREMIDPVSETKGLSEQVRNLFMSWEEAVRSLGYDPETVMEQSEKNLKAFEKAGLMPTSSAKFDSNRPNIAKNTPQNAKNNPPQKE